MSSPEATSALGPEIGLEELITVSPVSAGIFQGRCLTGAGGRIFGGQAAAQAFRAASLCVNSEHRPSSSQSLFLRPGNPELAVFYTVVELKAGRSLSSYRIDATQINSQGDSTLILTALASFHMDEPSSTYQDTKPEVISAEDCDFTIYLPSGGNPAVRSPVEFRWPDPRAISSDPLPPRQLTWLKSKSELSDHLAVQSSALIYISDLTLTRTAHMPLRSPQSTRLGASLDHMLWFHRPFKADEWMLFEQATSTYAGARSLSNGKVFSASGELIATVTQEALIRQSDAM